MSHEIDIQNNVPPAIYPPNIKGGLRELSALIGRQIDLLEAAAIVFNAPENQLGVGLDRIGQLFGVFRDGRSDEEYRNALTLEFISQGAVSIPELYDILPPEIIYAKIEPYSRGATTRFRWDGRILMNGSDTMTPIIKFASAGFTMRRGGVETDHSSLVFIPIQSAIDAIEKNRMRGLLFYYKLEYELDVSDITKAGLGPWDGTPTPTYVKIHQIQGASELHEKDIPVSVVSNQVVIDIYQSLVWPLTEVSRIRFYDAGDNNIAACLLDNVKIDYNSELKITIGGFP